MRARTRNTVAAVLTGALIAVASPAIAHAQSPKSDDVPLPVASILAVGDGKYGVQNYKSKKFLQPAGASTANGAKIVQQSESLSGSDYSAVQNWNAFNSGGDLTSFENSLSHKNLGIDGASTAVGAAAIQANPAGDANQDWQFITKSSYPSGWYALKNSKSKLCLGISGASTANGAQAAQFTCDDSDNQLWRIIDR
ncbi:RICIN domain-containing protein [Streptomyces sp. NBC_01635]|uniref:RICIN domain-containing protein n=1 Tax=Streptomyces sp. NBC_01635 TaxID=2975904 RepID=UPI00386DB6D6|nr:RICIN domain-containing protein [Streptomyces sp. NBC_01635]WTD79520.1 RICIN domain-containing protein [Streptomyces sp. NBC_01635]